jgi:hypothetical protein
MTPMLSPPDRERLAAWGVMAAGIGLALVAPTVGAELLTDPVAVALTVGGGLVLFAGALWDDTICRRDRDERQAEIHYRSGYNAMIVLVALFGTLFLAMVGVDYRPAPLVVWALTMAMLPVYYGSVLYYRRVM